jgi:hypothetical protein
VTGYAPHKEHDMNQQATIPDESLWGAPPPPDGHTQHGAPVRRWVMAVAGTVVIGVAAVAGAHLASSGTRSLGTAAVGGAGGGPGGVGGPGGRGGNIGTIAAIDGSTIKMTTQAGSTVSVVTSASTTVTVTSTGALADVKVGDNVRVAGAASGTTVAASQVTGSGASALADGPAGGAPGAPPAGGAAARGGAPVSGVVKSVGAGTFSISTADGSTLGVTTTSATTVSLVKPGALGALHVGDRIQVSGTTAADGAITAASIRSGILTAGPGAGPPGA